MSADPFILAVPGPPISAFPVMSVTGQPDIETSPGMELRDYFAAQVMAEIARRYKFQHEHAWDGMASVAYAYADTMVRVRGQT